MKIRPRRGSRRLASAAACLTTVACALTTAPAFSAPIKTSATGPSVPAIRLIARTPTSSARAHTVPNTTSTTVMGGGNPSTWPAAKKAAPSLAGAYSSNMKTVFLALVRYSDWLGSHPNPKLVKNFVLTSSNLYPSQLSLMQQMVHRGWHITPRPTQIDFLKTVGSPVTKSSPSGRKYKGAVIETVIDEVKSPYLDGNGRIVGYTGGGGPTAYVATLVQNSLHTQFYIDLWQQLAPPGTGLTWLHRIEKTQ
jgi:hypothetical protein